VSEIRIPFPDPIEPEHTIAKVHDEIRKSPELDGGERELAVAVVVQALWRGTTRAVDLQKELEGAGAREIVDKARESIGLRTIAEEEADQRFERENANLPPGRDAEGKAFMGCADPNCNAYPLNEMGVPAKVVDRVWWCDRHRDQAGPEDHLPPEPKYVWDMATMSLRAIGKERERLLEEDRERERKAAERQRIQREEAERLAKLEREWQLKNVPVFYEGPRPPQ
jgi:hypothetical protein